MYTTTSPAIYVKIIRYASQGQKFDELLNNFHSEKPSLFISIEQQRKYDNECSILVANTSEDKFRSNLFIILLVFLTPTLSLK